MQPMRHKHLSKVLSLISLSFSLRIESLRIKTNGHVGTREMRCCSLIISDTRNKYTQFIDTQTTIPQVHDSILRDSVSLFLNTGVELVLCTYRDRVVNATAPIPIPICVHHMLIILENIKAMEAIAPSSGKYVYQPRSSEFRTIMTVTTYPTCV